MSEELHSIADLLLSFENRDDSLVIIYPHVGADGDALGSAQALFLALKKLEINSLVLVDEEQQQKLLFLPGSDQVQVYQEADFEKLAACQKLAFAVDCADSVRVGRRRQLFEQAPQEAVIDHHASSDPTGELRLIDITAAATGELIYALIESLEEKTEQELLDHAIATCLMAAIISDTGSFGFSNTTARTFRVASKLMAWPLDLAGINFIMFYRTSRPRLQLAGAVLNKARFELDGRIAIGFVPTGLMEEIGALDEDLDGLVGQLRNAEGVEVAFLLREQPDGSIRVNIRSNENFNAAKFACLFEGGGHVRAAGLTLTGINLQEGIELILAEAKAFMQKAKLK